MPNIGRHPQRIKDSKKKKLADTGISEPHSAVTNINMPKLIELFHNSISTGLEFVCTCCSQL